MIRVGSAADAASAKDWRVNVLNTPMRGTFMQVYFVLAAAVLSLAVLLGGSSQRAMLTTALLELASLPLLGAGLWLQTRHAFRGIVWPVAILVAGIAVTACQLVPLPIGFWSSLPGRETVLGAMKVAGVAPTALPASLSPDATARALAALLPGVAIFFGVLGMSWEARRRLCQLLLALGAVSALIGLVQAVGQLSGFYSVTNPGSAVGFFANRNHFAALLYALIPLAAGVGTPSARSRPADRTRLTVTYAAVAAVLMLGIVASGSRTGLALALVAILGGGALWIQRLSVGSKRIWAPLVLIGTSFVLVAALQFTRVGAFTQEKVARVDEGRGIVTATTFDVAQVYAPIGSGLGSFPALYEAAEPFVTLSPEYVNHAHDDWAELWLEGGVPLAGVIAAFLAWYSVVTVRAWSPSRFAPGPGQAMRRAASLSLGLLLIHSVVDYPLRTGTLMSVFGFACALLATPGANGATRPCRNAPHIDTSNMLIAQ